MTVTLQTLLPLVAVLVVMAVLAWRLKTAPSILLVIAGVQAHSSALKRTL